jgi:protease-4
MAFVGYATANEIMAALQDFRTSGKKVYGYINTALQKDIYLLGAADEVYMNPSASAGFFMHGMGGSIEFYRDALQKLGIQMHVVRAGDYKGAGEPFSRSRMSPELRRNLSEIYSDRYQQVVSDFARNFETTEQNFVDIFERRDKFMINLSGARDSQIVTDLMFFDAFCKKIGVHTDNLVKHTRYTAVPERRHTQKIALVYMLGTITSNKARFGEMNITSAQYNKIFDKLIADDNVRAVVIRVNSGGGSALESEIIYNKLAQLREKKPVIISMGDMAASGGYYITANANYIFADPYTVTGSIGVFGMIPDLSETGKKLGIHSETIGHGKFLSVYSTFTGYSRALETGLQIGVNETYHEFKTRVAEGRGMAYEDVEAIAQGLVWSAKRALEHNLIDEIGLMGDAINKAIEISHLGNHTVVTYPEKKNFFDVLMSESLNIDLVKTLVARRFPRHIDSKTAQLLHIYEDIKKNPIQMRADVIVED